MNCKEDFKGQSIYSSNTYPDASYSFMIASLRGVIGDAGTTGTGTGISLTTGLEEVNLKYFAAI